MEGIAIFENASLYVTIEYDSNKIIDSIFKDNKIIKLDNSIKGAYSVGAYPKEGVNLGYISSGSWEISLNDALKAANDYIINTL